ncbi:Uncharacterised protein g4370 [Pycnogonum litorale]
MPFLQRTMLVEMIRCVGKRKRQLIVKATLVILLYSVIILMKGYISIENTVVYQRTNIFEPNKSTESKKYLHQVEMTSLNTPSTSVATRRLKNGIWKKMNSSWVLTTTKVSLDSVQFFNDPKYLCNKLDASEMLIVVHSSVGHDEQRNALRNTIGIHRYSFKINYTMMFVVGFVDKVDDQERIFEEYNKHQDMLLMMTPDSYNFMSYKALGWLKFLALGCTKFKYILKIDDDVLVNFNVLTDEIKKCEITKTNSGICVNLSCCLWTRAIVHRSGDIEVTFKQYKDRHWPDMCPGVAYILPQRIAKNLWEAAESSSFVWLDDVYVTAFLRQTAKENIFPINEYYLTNFDDKYINIKTQRKMFGHIFNHKKFKIIYSKYWKILNSL